MFSVVSFLGAIVLLPGSVPAPVPKYPAPVLSYFPAKKGTQWVYEVTGDSKGQITETVIAVEKEDGGQLVSLSVIYEEVVDGVKTSVKWIEKRRLEEHGLIAIAPWPEVAGSEACLLKLPPKPGMKWEEDHPGVSLKRSCEVFKPEKIKVHAGEYQALRVNTRYTPDGGKECESRDDWYAPGVGLVKQERRDIARTLVLKSYTPGK